jgi:hypothetical protein
VSSGDAPASCKLAKCGDGKTNKSGADGTVEQCDNGTANNGQPGNACSATCHTVSCGNGFKEGTEECDDGNNSNTDDCVHVGTSPVLCKLATCGDGFVNARFEDCDHGATNGQPGDTCSADCRSIACGNGRIDSGELCDDANGLACGACSADCSTVTPAEAATGVIIAAAADLLQPSDDMDTAHNDTFRIKDGVGGDVTFTFVTAAPTLPSQIRLVTGNTNVDLAGLIATAIQSSGLQLTATRVNSTAVVVLTNKVKTSRGNQSIVNNVATSNFAATGLDGGHSGDCTNNTGCTANSDCQSNNCVTNAGAPPAKVCKACALDADCGAGRTCNTVAGSCSP